jgi:hypothetical protein
MSNFFIKDGCVVAFFYSDEKTAGDGEDTRVGTVVVAKIEKSPRGK